MGFSCRRIRQPLRQLVGRMAPQPVEWIYCKVSKGNPIILRDMRGTDLKIDALIRFQFTILQAGATQKAGFICEAVGALELETIYGKRLVRCLVAQIFDCAGSGIGELKRHKSTVLICRESNYVEVCGGRSAGCQQKIDKARDEDNECAEGQALESRCTRGPSILEHIGIYNEFRGVGKGCES